MADTNKKQTLGNFNVTGYITVDDKTFEINKAGKNNPNWIMNVFNPKIESLDGKSMFMRFQDGFDNVKGKQIYALIKGTRDTMKVNFADRNNQTIIEQLDEKSFIKIGLRKEKVKNEETGKEYDQWVFNQFLSTYDAIKFLSEYFPIGHKFKVRIRGRQKFNLYNGEVSRNYDIQTIYLLDEMDNSECEFSFTQNVLLTDDCVVMDKWETEGIATINTKVYQKKKKDEYEVLNVPMIIRGDTEEKKATYTRVIDKFFKVDEGKIRRINIDGLYNSGYIVGNVTEEDLPDEAKELIEDGLYSKEEVMKMYASKERVDEMLIKRPHMKKINDKPSVDYDDTEFTPEDLVNLIVEPEKVEEVVIPDEKIDVDLLNELENL